VGLVIKLISLVGHKMPAWVNTGFAEYAKRLPADYQLQLIDIPSRKHPKNSGEKLLLAAQPPIIALDRQGQSISTAQLAAYLQQWHDAHQNPSLLVGGPDGLSPDCLKQAEKVWSLSALTFPHPLVRIILAEQIYRAWSIISHHPYHRS
jgi:23S rRNA (pseudouridine1915-N3)-methyltransferase